MRQVPLFNEFTASDGRRSRVRGHRRASQPIAAIEPLEGRTLLSASVTAGITLHEQAGIRFTADLGNFVTVAPGTGLSATINWGDGRTSQGTIKADGVVGLDEINFEVDGTHKFKTAGTFAIKATVTQQGPGSTTPVRIVDVFHDIAVVSRGNTLLNGSITGTYSAAPTSIDTGAECIFRGKGTAGDLGAVSAQGNVILPGLIATGNASGTLTLTSTSTTATAAGSVTLKLTGPPEKGFGPFPTTLNYDIIGGTGAFAGATGIGTIAVTLGGPSGSNAFTFDITSLLPPVAVG